MKKKNLFTFTMIASFLIASVALMACGQSGSGTGGASLAVATANSKIAGVVKDIATGSTIAGATVSTGTQNAVSNSSGAYSLAVAGGNYTLSVSAAGYLVTRQITTVVSGATQTVNWALTKSYGNQSIPASSYVVLAWNDLGMHCDQDDYSNFCVLPPFNTLHAQVFRHGGDSGLSTSGITVSYAFPKKTNSTLHTNFWTYAAKYGWNVPANVGITGTPLAGNMSLDSKGLGFVATGIPITPYDDDGTWDPYGTAVLTVKNSTGTVLQTANVVAPVSTEMMCSNCHGTTNTQLNILQAHDSLSGTHLAADQAAGILHVCGSCHQDNALGLAGQAGIESLSLAMHNFHKDKMNTTATSSALTPDCYNCHPGPKTQCERGIMARAGKSCHDCHGDMYAMTNSLKSGRQAWLQEPQCGSCHDAGHAENSNTLYRNSVLKNGPTSDMNNKIYCEACHNSTHGEYTTSNPADTSITTKFQGDTYWIWNCNVCHSGMTQRSMHSGSGTTSTSGTTSSTSTSGTTTTTSTSGSDDSTSTSNNYYNSTWSGETNNTTSNYYHD
jgi:CarboxypepD_reg-like domain